MFKKLFRKKKKIENPDIQKLIDLSRKIETYTGTLEEFKNMKNTQYKVLDNGRQDKRVRFYSPAHCLHDGALLELKLMDQIGAEALIRYEDRKVGISLTSNIVYYSDPWIGQGIPVRRIK